MQEAAFFDLDKTTIAGSALLALRRPLRDEGLINRRTLLRGAYAHVVYAMLGADEDRMDKLRDAALRLTRGWEQTHVAEVVREAIESHIKPIVYKEALEIMRAHRDEGRKIVLVSASTEEVVKPLGDYVQADHTICTRAHVDANGVYTGKLAFYAYGPAKVEAMEKLATDEDISLSASYAYSDSITDLPMLGAVGHPYVVNPDRALCRVAVDQGWPVLRFAHPVSIYKRVPNSMHVLATAAVAGVVGSVAFRWARRRS